MTGLTDRELQSLRNEGNAAERAADEIVALRAEVERLRAAPAPVARQAGEPVAIVADNGPAYRAMVVALGKLPEGTKLYTAPPAAPAPVVQPLTDDQILARGPAGITKHSYLRGWRDCEAPGREGGCTPQACA